MVCIAVVDDEAPVRTALARLLRLADYEVATFESADAFLASLDAGRPGCVLLDIHLPGLTGFDVLMRLRAAQIDVPVIFITASDNVRLDQAAAQAGVAHLLRKPFSNAALLAAVEATLRAPSGHPVPGTD